MCVIICCYYICNTLDDIRKCFVWRSPLRLTICVGTVELLKSWIFAAPVPAVRILPLRTSKILWRCLYLCLEWMETETGKMTGGYLQAVYFQVARIHWRWKFGFDDKSQNTGRLVEQERLSKVFCDTTINIQINGKVYGECGETWNDIWEQRHRH